VQEKAHIDQDEAARQTMTKRRTSLKGARDKQLIVIESVMEIRGQIFEGDGHRAMGKRELMGLERVALPYCEQRPDDESKKPILLI
jgi:hypothetical protein